jgi:type III secretory pathway component EscT
VAEVKLPDFHLAILRELYQILSWTPSKHSNSKKNDFLKNQIKMYFHAARECASPCGIM